MLERLNNEQAEIESLAYRPILDGYEGTGDLTELDVLSARLGRSRQLLNGVDTLQELEDLNVATDGEDADEVFLLEEVIQDAPYINPAQAIKLYELVFDNSEDYRDLASSIATGGLRALTCVDQQASIDTWLRAYKSDDEVLNYDLETALMEDVIDNPLIELSPEFTERVVHRSLLDGVDLLDLSEDSPNHDTAIEVGEALDGLREEIERAFRGLS